MNYTKRPLTVGDIVIYVDLAIVPIAYIVMAVGSFMCMEWPSQKPTAITLEETLHILRDDIKSKYDSGYSVREAPIQEDAYSNGEHISRDGIKAYEDYDAYTILDFEREINLLVDWINYPEKVTSYVALGTYGAGDLSLTVMGELDSSSLTEFSFTYEDYQLCHWSSFVNGELIRYDFSFA